MTNETEIHGFVFTASDPNICLDWDDISTVVETNPLPPAASDEWDELFNDLTHAVEVTRRAVKGIVCG